MSTKPKYSVAVNSEGKQDGWAPSHGELAGSKGTHWEDCNGGDTNARALSRCPLRSRVSWKRQLTLRNQREVAQVKKADCTKSSSQRSDPTLFVPVSSHSFLSGPPRCPKPTQPGPPCRWCIPHPAVPAANSPADNASHPRSDSPHLSNH